MAILTPSLFFVAATCVAFASVHFGPCSSGGESKQPGDTWFSENCLKHTCGISPKGETYTETITCTEVQVTAPCEVSSKPYETYPKCCPVIKCTAPATSNTEASESGTNFQPYIWNFSGHGRK